MYASARIFAVSTVAAATLVAGAFAGLPSIARPSSSAAVAPRPATGTPEKVIVLLGSGQRRLPTATRAHLAARRAAISTVQSPVRTQIGQLGGHTTKVYRAVDALAATVPSGGVAALRALPGVTAVVPDLPISMASPTPTDRQSGSGSAAPSAAAATGDAYCPTDPSKPLLEPEALSLTHTDSDTPNANTARSLGYTGAGVKVGFIADGTDINQPDLIRADGTHVVTDYQDFSGDGTDASSSAAPRRWATSAASPPRAARATTSPKYVNPSHPQPAGCNDSHRRHGTGCLRRRAEGVLQQPRSPRRPPRSSRRSTTR